MLFKGLQREFSFAYLSKDPPTALLWMTFWRLLRLAEYAVSLFRGCCWCPYYLLQRVWSFYVSSVLLVSLLSAAKGMAFLCFVGIAGVLTICCKGCGVSLFRGYCWCPYYLLQGVWSFFVLSVLLVSLLSAARGAEFPCFERVAGVPTIYCKGCGVSLFRLCCRCPS